MHEQLTHKIEHVSVIVHDTQLCWCSKGANIGDAAASAQVKGPQLRQCSKGADISDAPASAQVKKNLREEKYFQLTPSIPIVWTRVSHKLVVKVFPCGRTTATHDQQKKSKSKQYTAVSVRGGR
jgi:hypothetical protein